MANTEKYQDHLVEIGNRRITFLHYGIFGGSRTVPFKEIEEIKVLKPMMRTGKYRCHGTGDLRTWFPRDFNRSSRQAIFLVKLKNSWRRIGFTVEDAGRVFEILQDARLVAKDASLEFDSIKSEKSSRSGGMHPALIAFLVFDLVAIPMGIILYVVLR